MGLELRPRRLREAATLWASLKAERGVEGRDAVWKHPDLLPTAEDLDDPQGFSERRKLAEASDSEVDDALQKLLSGGFDEPADTGATDAEGPNAEGRNAESPDTAKALRSPAGPVRNRLRPTTTTARTTGRTTAAPRRRLRNPGLGIGARDRGLASCRAKPGLLERSVGPGRDFGAVRGFVVSAART